MPDPKDKAQKAADDYLEDDYDNDWANYDYDNDPEGYYMHAGEFNYKLPTIGNSIIDSESTAVGSKDYKLYDAVLRRQKRVDDYWQYINEKEAKATLKRETRDEPSEWSKSKEKNRAEARLIGKERGSDWEDEFFNTDAVQDSYKMANDADPFVSSWMQDDETQRRMRNQALYPNYEKVVAANEEGQKRLRELPIYSRELTNQNDIGYLDIWNNSKNQGWDLNYGLGLGRATMELFGSESNIGSYIPWVHQAAVDRFEGGNAHGTVAHELTHSTGMDPDGWQGINETAIRNNWPDTKDPFKIDYKERSQSMEDYLEYLGDDGLYPRIMDIRRTLNLSPGEEVTREMLKNPAIKNPVEDLQYFKSDEQILEMLNTLADSGEESGGEYNEEYNEIPRAEFGGRLPQHGYGGEVGTTTEDKLSSWLVDLPTDSGFGSEIESTYAEEKSPENISEWEAAKTMMAEKDKAEEIAVLKAISDYKIASAEDAAASIAWDNGGEDVYKRELERERRFEPAELYTTPERTIDDYSKDAYATMKYPFTAWREGTMQHEALNKIGSEGDQALTDYAMAMNPALWPEAIANTMGSIKNIATGEGEYRDYLDAGLTAASILPWVPSIRPLAGSAKRGLKKTIDNTNIEPWLKSQPIMQTPGVYPKDVLGNPLYNRYIGRYDDINIQGSRAMREQVGDDYLTRFQTGYYNPKVRNAKVNKETSVTGDIDHLDYQMDPKEALTTMRKDWEEMLPGNKFNVQNLSTDSYPLTSILLNKYANEVQDLTYTGRFNPLNTLGKKHSELNEKVLEWEYNNNMSNTSSMSPGEREIALNNWDKNRLKVWNDGIEEIAKKLDKRYKSNLKSAIETNPSLAKSSYPGIKIIKDSNGRKQIYVPEMAVYKKGELNNAVEAGLIKGSGKKAILQELQDEAWELESEIRYDYSKYTRDEIGQMKMRIDQIEDEFAALDIVDEGDDVFGNSNIYAEAKPNTYAKNHRTKSYEERNHQFVLDMKKYYGKKIDAAQKKIPNLQKLPKINKNNSNFGFGGYIPTNPNLIINK